MHVEVGYAGLQVDVGRRRRRGEEPEEQGEGGGGGGRGGRHVFGNMVAVERSQLLRGGRSGSGSMVPRMVVAGFACWGVLVFGVGRSESGLRKFKLAFDYQENFMENGKMAAVQKNISAIVLGCIEFSGFS